VASTGEQWGSSRARDAMTRHEVAASGVLAGVAGGVAMMAVAAIGAASQGIPAVHPLEVIGASFVGPEALEGPARIAFGALVHLGTSVAFGVLFAAIVPRDFPTASGIGVGVGWALFGLGFMMSTIVPWANPGFRGEMQDVGGTWVIAHAVFGGIVGTIPALRRRLALGAAPRAQPASAAPGASRAAAGR
jgi:hypothetical protein